MFRHNYRQISSEIDINKCALFNRTAETSNARAFPHSCHGNEIRITTASRRCRCPARQGHDAVRRRRQASPRAPCRSSGRACRAHDGSAFGGTLHLDHHAPLGVPTTTRSTSASMPCSKGQRGDLRASRSRQIGSRSTPLPTSPLARTPIERDGRSHHRRRWAARPHSTVGIEYVTITVIESLAELPGYRHARGARPASAESAWSTVGLPLRRIATIPASGLARGCIAYSAVSQPLAEPRGIVRHALGRGAAIDTVSRTRRWITEPSGLRCTFASWSRSQRGS